MSGLLDKQVNAQKEKNFQGSSKLLQAHEKEMKQTNKEEKSDTHIKIIFMEGNPL